MAMTTEEKARAYDKAIERAKNIYGASECKDILCTLETIFPELKESERIRKAILWCIQTVEHELGCKDVEGLDIAKLKSWLEKQGEQNPVNKVEPLS